MKIAMMLAAQYDGLTIVPIERVCADYFRHLTPDKFLRKALAGDIPLPIVRMESESQKAAKGVPVEDLAEYLESRIMVARKERDQLVGATSGATSSEK